MATANSDKDTWCVYPFIHLATQTDGQILPCCIAKPYKNLNLKNQTIADAWHSEEVNSVRTKMLQGEIVPNCIDCYNVEKSGSVSYRQKSNNFYMKKYGINQNDYNDNTHLPISRLQILDLRLGNTCNLKCIMCRPQESHKWYEDILRLDNQNITQVIQEDLHYKKEYRRSDYNWSKNNLFWQNIDVILPYLRELTFGGGEPFMLKEVEDVLQRAVSNNYAKNLELRFHTNGTYLESRHFDLLQHFKKVELIFSIDGFKDINYFLRYPANWAKIINAIEENEKYVSSIETWCLCSLNAVSVYYLDQLFDFIADKDLTKLTFDHIILGKVQNPIYMNPQILDRPRKKIIEEKWHKMIKKYPSLANVLQDNLNWILTNNNNAGFRDLQSYIEALTRIRPLDKQIIQDFINAT
tara:strand:+ start:1675 stop:2904 length:1230 start_codon:yes stop_codon:yes gene_type:complete